MNSTSYPALKPYPTMATAPLPDAFSIPQPGIPQPVMSPGIAQPVMSPGIPQPVMSPGIAQPVMSPAISQPVMSPGIPQPVMSPRISQPVMSPGIPQPVMSPGTPQPVMSPGTPQPVMSPGTPQPVMSPGTPQPGVSPGISQPGMASGISQPGMASGIPQAGMASGIPQAGMASGIPQAGTASGIPQPAPPPYGISMPRPNAPQPELPTIPQGGWSPQNTICPPGLEYLIALDHLYIQQQFDLLDAIIGWENENEYLVKNVNGQPLFHVMEDSNICARLCLGTLRNCELHVSDTNHREVLRMVRPCRCIGCCCFCCMQKLEVYSGDMLLGSVTEDYHIFAPSFSIRDASGETVLRIKGPCFRCCGNAVYKIKSADGLHRVGEIKKKWCSLTTELFTDTDNFSLRFPVDLDVKIKAVLLGACILIDFMYFERSIKKSSI